MTLQSTTIFTEAEVPAKGKRSRKKRLLEHKRSFVFHYDEMNVVMELDDEDAGKFLKSIIAHAVLETGMTARKDIPLTDKQLRSLIKAANANGVLYVLYRQFITLFRIDNERYQRRVKSCSENGKKGGAPLGNTNAAGTAPPPPVDTSTLSDDIFNMPDMDVEMPDMDMTMPDISMTFPETETDSPAGENLSPYNNNSNPSQNDSTSPNTNSTSPYNDSLSPPADSNLPHTDSTSPRNTPSSSPDHPSSPPDNSDLLLEKAEKGGKNKPKQAKQAVIAKERAKVRAKVKAEDNFKAPDGAKGGANLPMGKTLLTEHDGYDWLTTRFNAMFHGILPEVRTLTDSRKRHVGARLREFGRDGVAIVLEKVRQSAFLTGGGRKGWRATFDWIFKPNNFAKILEGNYDYELKREARTAFESAAERDRRRNEEVKQRIFARALGHITGTAPNTAAP